MLAESKIMSRYLVADKNEEEMERVKEAMRRLDEETNMGMGNIGDNIRNQMTNTQKFRN